jgi:hypothetical protein
MLLLSIYYSGHGIENKGDLHIVTKEGKFINIQYDLKEIC